jgi:hypothetical protein
VCFVTQGRGKEPAFKQSDGTPFLRENDRILVCGE